MAVKRRRSSRRQSGQAVVEFAILVTVLLLIFLGTVDFARILSYQSAISSAARVGAEMASNHCEAAANCSISGAPATYDFVLQATVCESPNVPLQPAVSCSQVSTPSGSPCAGSCPPPCSQDVCITPAYQPGSTTTLASPQQITVSVGYDFRPISPMMNAFVQSDLNPAWKNGCFPGDPPHTHTICATVTGRAF
ncbi:MAG: TadE/TadG family type IV pilus assembly protein [Chloroflexota bacterium]